jgi:hypothetical protein
MNSLATIFFLAAAVALMIVPRRLAVVPLLVGCTYMTMAQGIKIGPASLPIYRMLLLVGVIRVCLRSERLPGKMNLIDLLMIGWGLWVIFCSMFHDQSRAGIVYACGIAFNQILFYFLIRIWCVDLNEVTYVLCMVALLLIPIAFEMIYEKYVGKNLFSSFGGVPNHVLIREGSLRAQGPFRHPILAGTVGATCLPLFIGIFKTHPNKAVVGIIAALVITLTSASSGPVMSTLAGMGAIILFRHRAYVPTIKKGAVGLYVILMLTMSKPPYYLISKIDISGGSTGWHRSYLIEQTFKHLSEWWAFGTDETRHWMPNQGFALDPHHTDITNIYIGFGVTAGVLGLIFFTWIMWTAFCWVGKVCEMLSPKDMSMVFLVWCIGSSLFAHAVTGLSVAYFDQSIIFLWLNIAVVSSVFSSGSMNTSRRYANNPATTMKSSNMQRTLFTMGVSNSQIIFDSNA